MRQAKDWVESEMDRGMRACPVGNGGGAGGNDEGGSGGNGKGGAGSGKGLNRFPWHSSHIYL